MDGAPPNDNWRNKYINKSLQNAAAEKQVHRVLLIRQATLLEIGGSVTLNNVIKAAVLRAKNKAIAARGIRGGSLYGTWHQHIGTKTRVFEEFRGILRDLGVSTDPHTPLMIELEEVWGTGYSVYTA